MTKRKRQVRPDKDQKNKVIENISKRPRGKRIMVTLPSRLVRRIDNAQMDVPERDRLIAKMLTEHFDQIEDQIEQELRTEKRRQLFGSVARKLGDAFLP